MLVSKTELDKTELMQMSLKKYQFPNIETVLDDRILDANLKMVGIEDCVWPCQVTAGSCSISSVTVKFHGENAVYTSNKDYFIRAYTCARYGLYGIVKRIPNFATVFSSAKILTAKMQSLTSINYVVCYSFPLTDISFANLLADPAVPLRTLISVYLQVIFAIVFAHKHVLFAHNMLFAANVKLSSYAPVFSINYSERSLLCFNYIAVICNYGHAQFSHISETHSIVHCPPNIHTGINLKPHESSDIYTFTVNCYSLIVNLVKRTAQTNPSYDEIYLRQRIFSEFLQFFFTNGLKEMNTWPKNIAPYSSGNVFLAHIEGVLRRHGFFLTSPVSETYGNIHLEPYCDVTNFYNETWFALDRRSLVVLGLPKPVETFVGRCLLGQVNRPETWEPIHLCSMVASEVRENDLAAVKTAMSEYPYLMTIHPDKYANLLAMPDFLQFGLYLKLSHLDNGLVWFLNSVSISTN